MLFLGKSLLHKANKEQKMYIITESYKSEIILSYLIILMQLSMTLIFLNKDGGIFLSWRRTSYFFSYVTLLAITIIFLISYKNLYKKKKYSLCYKLRIIYAVTIALWACFVTFVDQYGGNGIAVYSYMIISLAAIMIVSPIYSTSIFFTSFILLNILLSFIPDAESEFFNNIINTFIIMMLSIFISVRLYFGRIKEYESKNIIKKQYEEITVANEQLNKTVITDALTQLNNRRYLDENVREIFESNKSKRQFVAGLMLDIDFFKQYNDNYGHQQGDRCLIKIGEEIIKFISEENMYAVRYGGEEFFICCFGTERNTAVKRAEYLREKIANCGLIRNDLPSKHVTVSVGVCIRELNDDLEFEELIKIADDALYKAKKNGRNCVFCAD